MKREDLKDGMILIDSFGTKRVVCGKGKKQLNMNTWDIHDIDSVFLSNELNKAILKIEYDGLIIWEREKKYLTLGEAIETGKSFKHKDCDDYYFNLYMVIEDLRDYCVGGTKEINQYILSQINSKVWEVEEDEQD